jgi:hypothetical protein
MQIEPDAKIMHRHFRGQASLKASQVMRALPSQTERVQQLVIDGFNDLSQTGQKAPQGFGPGLPFAALMRRGNQIDLLLLVPLTPGPLPGNPLIGHIRPLGGRTSAGQAWRGRVTGSKQGSSQLLIMRARTCKAKAGNDALGRDAQQKTEPFVPPDAITPAKIRLTRQPTQAAPFGITGHSGRAVQHFVGRVLRVQKLHQKQSEGRDRIAVLPLEPIELTTIRQLRKRLSQMMLGIAVKRSFTRKVHALSKHGQRDHLTSAQRCLGAWFGPLWLIIGLAKIVYHDVECCYEGIQIDLKLAPFLMNWLNKLTVRSGSLLFKPFLIHTKRLRRPFDVGVGPFL